MLQNRIVGALLCALACAEVAACSAAGDASAPPVDGRKAGPTSASSTAAGGDSPASGSGGTGAGAPSASGGSFGVDAGAQQDRCAVAGSSRTCCRYGTQTCGNGELPIWGPCLDPNGMPLTSCDLVPPPPEKLPPPPPPPTTPPTTPPPPPTTPPPPPPPPTCGPGMECKPGAIRYCDIRGAEFSKATCTSDGTWGPCVATTAPPGWCDPTGFSPEICCPPLKLCCQNDPNGPFEDFGSGACKDIACP